MAQAVRSDSRNQGYQATAYVRSDAAKVDVQLVVVQLAETNWKVCADAVILPRKAQVSTQAASPREISKKLRVFSISTEHLLIRRTKQEKHTYFEMFHKVYKISENIHIFHHSFELKKNISHFKIWQEEILTFTIHQNLTSRSRINAEKLTASLLPIYYLLHYEFACLGI